MTTTGFTPWLLLCVLAAPASAQSEESVEYPHGGYRAECTLCHSPDGWRPARVSEEFEHPSVPLVGAHAQTDCRSCHESLAFDQLDPACVACHQDVHQGELGIDCARCHTSRNFIESSRMRRAHQLTRFPLRGGHAVLDCDTCHPPTSSGRMTYVNVQIECEACHLDEYQATTNPDHATAGFPTDCSRCHSGLVWQRVRLGNDAFNHDGPFFPIFSGKHRGHWGSCSDCHANQNNYSVFTCLQCHEHSQTRMDDKHSDEPGYQYDSLLCLSCHPQGRD